MNKKTEEEFNKQELFENTSISKALRILAGPAVVSQLISIVYNIADTFFIGRTGNSYMIAATTLSLTIMLMTISISNLFGIGGGSLMSRLSGMKKCDTARQASAYSFYGAIAGSLIYSFIIGVFIAPILELFGASQATFGYARTYTLIHAGYGRWTRYTYSCNNPRVCILCADDVCIRQIMERDWTVYSATCGRSMCCSCCSVAGQKIFTQKLALT